MNAVAQAPLLSARGLQKRFGAVVAADAVTIDVPAGQRLSCRTRNGSQGSSPARTDSPSLTFPREATCWKCDPPHD